MVYQKIVHQEQLLLILDKNVDHVYVLILNVAMN
jgi:hypothetical protein